MRLFKSSVSNASTKTCCAGAQIFLLANITMDDLLAKEMRGAESVHCGEVALKLYGRA